MIIPKLGNALAYGGDYNPEQWPEDVWLEDVRLMREAGVNFVTIAVFSWARLQPSERVYDFAWLDRLLNLLAANGIFADLATATASPPPWMSTRHPDVLAVDADRHASHPGSRQHYSPCSPTFRHFARKLVQRMATRYAHHPALAAWHISNEYTCHVQECHSPATTQAFRAWLKKRYRRVDALNAAWGTTFWSQSYRSWDEILTPRRTPYTPNPGQSLDFKRFMSDAFLELYTQEHDILRATSPDIPITTNVMGFHKALDLHKWSRSMDFVGWNSYPDPTPGAHGEATAAAGHDLMRSLKRDRPFILMEQSTGSLNWYPVCPTKPPGLMRLWSHQAVARGGDGVMFFQWRTPKYGAEKFMTGMIPHAGPTGSRVFDEVRELGADLARLAPVRGSHIRARVAIAFDWENWWAVELGAKPTQFAYAPWVQAVHRYFFERNIPVEFVHPSDDLGAYSLVIAPMLYLLRRSDAGNLATYTHNGGTLFITCFSGIVDENEHVELGGYPALLREVLGLRVTEWVPCAKENDNAFRFVAASATSSSRSHACGRWCEVVELQGATTLATFESDFIAGQPAFTRHQHGRGRACYLATQTSIDGLAAVLDHVCLEARVKPLLRTPAGVEATLREADDGRAFLFLLNHGITPARVALAGHAGIDLLTGQRVVGRTATLPSRGVVVLALNQPSPGPGSPRKSAKRRRAARPASA